MAMLFTNVFIVLLWLLLGFKSSLQTNFSDVEDLFLAKFRQTDYKIKEYRVEVSSYNKKFVRFIKVTTFKWNRTSIAINGTFNFKVDMKNELMTRIQGFKFLSNEYRRFPIRFQYNFWNAIDHDVMGILNVYKCGNVTRCEFIKDTVYHICNFVPDSSKLPPSIPDGRYKMECVISLRKEMVMGLDLYAEVYRPLN